MILRLFCVILMIAGVTVTGFAQDTHNDNQTTDNGQLPLPVVPDTLRTPDVRAAFIIAHFWDDLDFVNDNRAVNPIFMEQAMVNEFSIFPYADSLARKSGVDSLMWRAQAKPEALKVVMDIAEKYLYSTDSPMMDTESYIMFLEDYIASPVPAEVSKIRPRSQLEVAKKNRPGTQAADFRFKSREGKWTSLNEVPVKGDIMLIFYDPDCDHCQQIITDIKADPEINAKLANGTMTVLAIYSGDDFDLWEQNNSSLPQTWIVGYENGMIQDDGRYVIRELPSIYLLSSDRKVLRKEMRY